MLNLLLQIFYVITNLCNISFTSFFFLIVKASLFCICQEYMSTKHLIGTEVYINWLNKQ